MLVAVIGGTGTAGRATVASLERTGEEVRVISRSSGVDLVTGRGLRDALDGVSAVIDTTNVDASKRKPAERFFETTARNLTAAAKEAGIGHVVALSIVGADRVPYGYYQGKVRQEQVLEAAEVPTTILRATQFHEFAGQYLDRAKGRFVIVPKWRIQPVAVREVGDELAALALGKPAGTIEIAGPEVEEMGDLVRRVAQARGDKRRVVELRLPGAAGRAMASGGNTTDSPDIRGVEDFSTWFDAQSRVRAV